MDDKQIQDAAYLLVQYKNELAKVSTDLKPEVQAKQKTDINNKYRNDCNAAKGQLQATADQTAAEIAALCNPVFNLVDQAVSKSDQVTMGDMALITSIPGLPSDIVNQLAVKTKSPAVKMALLARAGSMDTTEAAKVRNSVLNGIVLPQDQINKKATVERRCLKVLIDHYTTPGDKMTWGRRMAELDKISK